MNRLRFLIPLSLSLVWTAPAVAQSAVVIWPVDPTIAPGEQATALWLENRGLVPVTLQVRSFAWEQTAGEDTYTEQDKVISSPPIAQVGPGQRQLVRLIRRTPDQAGEHAYRLLIDELPQPQSAPEGVASARLAVQMRYSIPLFTYGSKASEAVPNLTARVELAQGKRWLTIANSGTGRARLTDLRAKDAHGETSVRPGLVGYVLPGATMRWELPAQAPVDGPFTVGVNGTDRTLGTAS